MAIPAIKGPDSVGFGIKWLQKIKIVVDMHCQNTINELRKYKWKENKNGNVLPVPVDKFNHCLTGDTLVDTVDGSIPIQNLVEREGNVHCLDERKKKSTVGSFFDVRLTQKNVPVYKIELEEGGIIKTTGEHPVLTKKGWIRV